MDKTFQKFLRYNFDLSHVGVEPREDNTPYFCTPKCSRIFGWAGVDGIHYCFVRGFGGMVFAVSPANSAPKYVHPLAKNFADFLRLLLACGDAAALEQAWRWNKMQFDSFLHDNPPTKEQQAQLSNIAKIMKLSPIEHPFEYIKELQATFDYGKIKYTEDYYDVDMNPSAEPSFYEWKVFFDGNFLRHYGKDRAGKEIGLNKQFEWAGHHWIIPAAYSCSKGLVMDLCMRAEAEDIRSFFKKWNLSFENDSYGNFTREQQIQMDFNNPLCLNFSPRLEVNGKTMLFSHGRVASYNPCLIDKEVSNFEAKWVMDHYGLDASCGWVIYRNVFPWPTKRRFEVKTIILKMEQLPCLLTGPHFKVHAPGDSFTFTHPVSKTKYTLTVKEIAHKTLSKNLVDSSHRFYPTHFTVMSYTLFPEQSDDISICDCAEGDKPLEIVPAPIHLFRKPKMILPASALSAVRTVRLQSCLKKIIKAILAPLAHLCTLKRPMMTLSGVSILALNYLMKNRLRSYNTANEF